MPISATFIIINVTLIPISAALMPISATFSKKEKEKKEKKFFPHTPFTKKEK